MDRPLSQNDPDFIDSSIFESTPDTPAAGLKSTGDAGRPGGLTAVCVLATVLGGAGLLTGCSGLFSQLFASNMQEAFTAMPGIAKSPGADVQKEMNTKLLAVSRRYIWITVPLVVLKVAIESILLAGAIMSWGLKPRGRSWLLTALLAAIVVESLQIVPMMIMQRETFAVMSEFMPKMIAAQPHADQQPAGMGNFMSTASSALGYVSMIVAVGWLTAKIVYYAFAIRYLRKPSVAAVFESTMTD